MAVVDVAGVVAPISTALSRFQESMSKAANEEQATEPRSGRQVSAFPPSF